MIRHATLVAVICAVPAFSVPLSAGVGAPTQTVSRAEKTATVQNSVNRATECVIQAITNDLTDTSGQLPVGDLIVAVMPSCVERMRAMIDIFDSTYGAGTGETFFSGAFLDLLPIVVSRRIGRDVSGK